MSVPAERPINLFRGWPAPSLLPVEQLRAAANAVLTGGVGGGGEEAPPEGLEAPDSPPATVVDCLQYGPDAGLEALRAQLARHLGGAYAAHGAPADPARICVTGGASQGAACVLQSFTDPAYTAGVWVAAPCYYLMCPILEDAGFAGRLRAVPEDADGLDVAALEAGFLSSSSSSSSSPSSSPSPPYKPHLAPTRKAYRHVVYVVPTSSNPSGRTMSLARRQALVRLARRHDALLLADDVYDFLQWPVGEVGEEGAGAGAGPVHLPPPLPRLVDVDRMLPRESGDGPPSPFGHAVSNGSFSKIVAPGMRTGWVEAAPAFAWGLSQTGSSRSGGAPSQFAAAVVAELLRSGALAAALRDVVRPALRRRHRRLARAVAQHLLPYVTVACGLDGVDGVDGDGEGSDAVAVAPSRTYGGYFLWLRLRRPGLSAAAVAARARAAAGLVVAEGPLFAVRGDEARVPFDSHLRLCYAWEDEDLLEEGVRRLARVLRDWDEVDGDDGNGDGPSAPLVDPLAAFK